MAKLADFKGEIVQSGLHPGLPNQQIPLWEKGNNFVFKDNSAKIAAAHNPLFAKLNSLPGLGLKAINNEGAPALVWGDREGLYKGLTPPDAIDVTRLSGAYNGTDSDLWSIIQFGQSVLASNGVDKIQYLANIDTSTEFVDIDTVSDLAVGFRAYVLANTGAFALAMNTNPGGSDPGVNYEYRWCDEDDILTWTPKATNKARDIQARDLESDIVGVADLSDSLLLIGRDQVHIISFEGTPFFFPNRHLLSNVGSVSKHGHVTVGRQVFGFGPNGIWVIDGAAFQYIDDPSVHTWIYQDNYNDLFAERVVAWSDENESIAYFSFPTGDGTGLTAGFNYRSGSWSMYDWFRTAAATGGLWNNPVMVDSGGQVWIQKSAGDPVVSEGKPMTLSDAATLKLGFGMGGFGQGGYGGEWSVD